MHTIKCESWTCASSGHGTKVGSKTAFLYKLTKLHRCLGLWFPNWKLFSEKITLVSFIIHFRNTANWAIARARNNATVQNNSLTFKYPVHFEYFSGTGITCAVVNRSHFSPMQICPLHLYVVCDMPFFVLPAFCATCLFAKTNFKRALQKWMTLRKDDHD